jgi:hypothetical protein
MREDGRVFGGEEWQGEVYSREEWKKLVSLCTRIEMRGQEIIKLGQNFISTRIDFCILGGAE